MNRTSPNVENQLRYISSTDFPYMAKFGSPVPEIWNPKVNSIGRGCNSCKSATCLLVFLLFFSFSTVYTYVHPLTFKHLPSHEVLDTCVIATARISTKHQKQIFSRFNRQSNLKAWLEKYLPQWNFCELWPCSEDLGPLKSNWNLFLPLHLFGWQVKPTRPKRLHHPSKTCLHSGANST